MAKSPAAVASGAHGISGEERRVIFASSLGTVFEWYDFYLYATLAPFFAALFFPPGNDTAALLSAFATYAAGFLVRPFGAIFFGRIGDLVGRKYTFLVTMLVMGVSTVAVGFLPTYSSIGWLAPILLVILRLLQGLALGGEYGGAATYVAEHAPANKRGQSTAWIQTTATIGFFLSLLVIGVARGTLDKAAFAEWGWRLPFLVSAVLLVFSLYIRLKLNESPVFQRMKAEGKASKAPLTDSFLRYPNNKYVLLALLGATAGQGVVWYTGQFYALFFITITQKVDYLNGYWLVGAALLLGTPFFLLFGMLSDRIGRLKIILAGCLIAALTYIPLFQTLAVAVNPDLNNFVTANKISVTVDQASCHFNVFVGPWSKFSTCDRAQDFMTKKGLSFDKPGGAAGSEPALTIGDKTVEGFSAPAWSQALIDAGYPHIKATPGKVELDAATLGEYTAAADAKAKMAVLSKVAGKKIADVTKVSDPVAGATGGASVDIIEYTDTNADPSKINWPLSIGILFIMMIYVTMVYGPIAAFLVELFPTKIRYTSMSLPYHIGNGWFGGMLPLLATAMVASAGNIYYGLWYPIVVAAATAVIGFLFLHDTKDADLHN